MRAIRITLLSALGLLVLVLLLFATPENVACAKGDGPCFLFPKEEDYSYDPYGAGYHDGCEGTGWTCGPIKGYDYIADKGTPILAPFDGKTTATCHHDGVGNTVFAMRNGEYEFGVLHLTCAVKGVVEVKAGQIIGYVASIGHSSEPHAHVWFRNLSSGANIKNHNQFWNCIGGEPEPPPIHPPAPLPEGKSWFEQLKEWLGSQTKALIEWLKGIVKEGEGQPGGGDGTVEHEKLKFSISAQQPGNSGYQHNIRAFFAWPTSGYSLAKMNEIDLNNFEGSVTLKPGEKTSVVTIFGTEKFEEGQGMVAPPGFKIGDGSCNASSMVAAALAAAGIDVRCDTPEHPPIPGVPEKWQCTVCVPSKAYPCTLQDIHIENQNNHPVELHWKISGDNLYLWVVEEVVRIDTPIEIDWGRVAILAGVLIAIIVFFVKLANRRPDLTGQAMVWVNDNTGSLKQILREAFKLAWSWNILIITSAIVISPELREMVRVGLSQWVEGDTTLANWQIVAIIAALFVNLLIRAITAGSKPQTRAVAVRKLPDGTIVRKKLPDGTVIGKETNKWWWVWILIGLIYAVSPLDAPIPFADDTLVMIISLYQALPPHIKRRMKLGLVLCILAPVLIFVGWIGFLNPSYFTFAGLYGHLGPGGWGSLSEYTTAEQAVEAAQAYAREVDSFNGARFTIPVVNLVHRNEDDATIKSVIEACSMKCIVMLDISPQEDVLAIIDEYTWWNQVWFDVDLEHKKRDITDVELDLWAAKYFDLRIKRGLFLPGVFAIYDFKSNPQIWPNKAVIWQYPNGLVVPIFDGHCSGEPCKQTKWAATRLFLENYASAKQFGLMEFVTKWGCGSQYGDCGFELQEYWGSFQPLIFLGQ